MDTACIVCSDTSRDMFKIESEAGKRKNIEQLLLRFGGLTVKIGRICRSDLNQLLDLTRRADKFYNQCQTSQFAKSVTSIISERDKVVVVKDVKLEPELDLTLKSELDGDVLSAINGECIKSEVNLFDCDEDTIIESEYFISSLHSPKHLSVSTSALNGFDFNNSQPKKTCGKKKSKKLDKKLQNGKLNSAKSQSHRKMTTKKSNVRSYKHRDIHKISDSIVEDSSQSYYNGGDVLQNENILLTEPNLDKPCATDQRDDIVEFGKDKSSSLKNQEKRKRRRDRRNRAETNICHKCGAIFHSRSGFDAHMKSHGADAGRPHKCEICSKTFSRPTYLQYHLRTVHVNDDKKITTVNGDKSPAQDVPVVVDESKLKELPCFVCHECGKRLTSNFKLKYHMESHTSSGVKRPHSCSVCDKAFRQANALRIHMRIHTGETPYRCTECERAFADSYVLRRHMALNHSTTVRLPCTECNRNFASAADLEEHMPIHNRVKKYSCPTCARPFRSRSNLSKHKKIHVGVREFDCKVCKTKTFLTSTHLKRHMVMVHSVVRQFACTECTSAFTSAQSLKRHSLLHTQAWMKKE